MFEMANTDKLAFGVGEIVLATALDALKVGILIADESYSIAYTNEEARRIIGMISGCSAIAAAGQEFAQTYCRTAFAANVKNAQHIFVRAPLPQRRSLTMKIKKVDDGPSRNTLFVMTFFLQNDLTKDTVTRFGQLYSLTRTEARVLEKMYAGLSSTEIAANERASVNTVRTHVKSIMAKTGYRRQSMLVRELAVFAQLDGRDDDATEPDTPNSARTPRRQAPPKPCQMQPDAAGGGAEDRKLINSSAN